MREQVMAELKNTFRPEFLNRIDETIVFHRLTEEDMYAITQTLLDGVKKRFEKLGLRLIVPDETARFPRGRGHDDALAARGPPRGARRTTAEGAGAGARGGGPPTAEFPSHACGPGRGEAVRRGVEKE